MIAKILSESIIMKNSSLQTYLNKNFVDSCFKDPDAIDFFRRSNYTTWDLSDSMPGVWFVRHGYLWVSYSQRFRYETMNRIIVFLIDEDRHYLIFKKDLVLPFGVNVDDEDAMERAGLCVRKFMRKLAAQKNAKSALKSLEDYSDTFHEWTKEDVKEI